MLFCNKIFRYGKTPLSLGYLPKYICDGISCNPFCIKSFCFHGKDLKLIFSDIDVYFTL